ncbi:bacteriohemerythrin [Sulfuricurvum sp.]|uniref:bacteriohemerythrin n=1 Tax=Sulfuricurvum sp. TaxID=2025608 RepID=UPI002609216E|nr:hemerythrin family protein [Sulfuricurvum sp.]MDD2266168.1 hemerythrin family protein [Sulfuricurvum sp.]MDD2784539.1 hemerythrin family protein [Sulfuricurvum sp.]HZF70877.1 hemerythrin family protein [Sulfuricurvum sp.]
MATGLEWGDQYLLGIKGIDEQHRYLFEIVGRIASLDAVTSSKEELRQILGELSRYMSEHFRDEEAYLQQIGFPELEYHKKLHREIIEFFNASITNSPTIAMIQTKLKFIIKKALIDHIINEDMKIKLYCATQQVDTDEYVYDLG